MKRNLVGKILGKIKIFVQDFVPIRTALRGGLSRKHKYMFRVFEKKCRPLKVRGKVSQASISHACSYFTGAVYVYGTSVVLKNLTFFVNNTAIYGSTTIVKCFP